MEEIKSEKTIYIVEETEEYKKMKRIDELAIEPGPLNTYLYIVITSLSR